MRRVDTDLMLRIALPFVLAAVGVGAGFVLSDSLSGYYVYLAVGAVVAAIAILGLGIVTGSAGMIALCQLTFAAVGAWVVAWLNLHNAPGGFIVWLLLGGLAAGAVGVLVGLPALRLRGVNLAVVTLGFAAAADVTLVQIQFPGSTEGFSVLRPAAFSDDRSYFVLSVMVLAACAVVVYFLKRTRWGSSWKFVAFSERGTASVGASVGVSKLTAFATCATLGGISGGLIAGLVGLLYASSFTPIQSLALYVLAVMSGAHLIDMAIFGGILWVAVPELLKRWGVPQDWAFVIFGVLGVQAITSQTNLGQAIRNVWWNRLSRRTPARAVTDPARTATEGRRSPTRSGAPILAVEGLGVTFGQVKALHAVDLVVPENTITGLIGPNGAGKSTFVDAVTGFLPQHEGTVSLDGRTFDGVSPTRRARRGLRRTFQQDRVPPTLTVEAYARFVARRQLTDVEIDETLAFFGCPAARTRLQSVDVGTRRLVEVAANVMSRPRVLILDEPAAGLSHEEHVELGQRLTLAPERFEVSIVLIEHDLDLVRSVCSSLTVLDFGEVLASGPQADVLADPAVVEAYMGEAEVG